MSKSLLYEQVRSRDLVRTAWVQSWRTGFGLAPDTHPLIAPQQPFQTRESAEVVSSELHRSVSPSCAINDGFLLQECWRLRVGRGRVCPYSSAPVAVSWHTLCIARHKLAAGGRKGEKGGFSLKSAHVPPR